MCTRCGTAARAAGHSYCLRCKRLANIRSSFGVSEAAAERLYARARTETCAVCGQRDEGRWGVLAIDHDHETGEIRGLLCGRCNLVLGKVGDNVKLLAALAAYLHGKTA